jgi:hypothetical protein
MNGFTFRLYSTFSKSAVICREESRKIGLEYAPEFETFWALNSLCTGRVVIEALEIPVSSQ